MAEPARSAAGPGPDSDPERREHDLLAPGWACTQRLLITAAEGAAAAAAELAARPDCALALRRAEILTAALADLGVLAGDLAEIERGRKVDEAVHEAELARVYAQGVADCKAARRRMEVIGGGAAGRA